MTISKQYSAYIFAVIMSLAMGFVMSLFMTVVNIGVGGDFILRWVKSFGVGFLVAFPTALIIAPVSRKIVSALTESPLAD